MKVPRRSKICRCLPVLLILGTLAGCSVVGPNYSPPGMETDGGWRAELENGLVAKTPEAEALAQWWRSLEDPILDELIQRAVDGSPNLKLARARIREARARHGLSRTADRPVVDASAGASRRRTSENGTSSAGGTEFDLYDAGFDAGWEIDIFGAVRRSVEAAAADLAAREADLDDVRVSLVAETALNYLQMRTYQARLDVAEANIRAQQKTHDLILSRFEAGLSNELALQQARYNLENTRSLLPTLRAGLTAARNRLCLLTGNPPGELDPLLEDRRPIPVPPMEVAVGIPAETLRRRPDIRRAEKELAAQCARIGVAEAELYPRLRLLGSIGLESVASEDFLQWASRYWSLGPTFSWRIFDAGAVRRNIEIQTAIEAQRLIAYETAVLGALEEVENALTAFAEEQLRRENLLEAVDAAARAVDLAKDQYAAGLIGFTEVLDAQRSLLSFEDQLARSDGAVMNHLISLYKALGGGWNHLE